MSKKCEEIEAKILKLQLLVSPNIEPLTLVMLQSTIETLDLSFRINSYNFSDKSQRKYFDFCKVVKTNAQNYYVAFQL